jgi:hypothetical protein
MCASAESGQLLVGWLQQGARHHRRCSSMVANLYEAEDPRPKIKSLSRGRASKGQTDFKVCQRGASSLVSKEKTAPNAALAGQGRHYLLSVLLTGFGNRGTCRS